MVFLHELRQGINYSSVMAPNQRLFLVHNILSKMKDEFGVGPATVDEGDEEVSPWCLGRRITWWSRRGMRKSRRRLLGRGIGCWLGNEDKCEGGSGETRDGTVHGHESVSPLSLPCILN